MVALGSCNLWPGEFQVNSCHGQDAISVLRKNEDLILVSLPFPGFTDRKLRQRPTTRRFAKRGWFFVNSCSLSYLGEANSKVELWPSKRISRSWRHHLPASLQSSRHGDALGIATKACVFSKPRQKMWTPRTGDVTGYSTLSSAPSTQSCERTSLRGPAGSRPLAIHIFAVQETEE